MTDRPDCEACAAAQKSRFSALVLADCRQCVVRSIAKAPSFARNNFYERIEKKDRAAFVSDVTAEYHRLQGMKS